MNIHKLHIIGINRDAVASQKGYSYQQLKTLEDWIENRIKNGNDEIYCEYEDDIYAQDAVEGKSTFNQIKLYSKDFSFSSESVINAIENFFSLYVKGEYSFDKLQFNFETNVSVVGKQVLDNDAKLLAEWNKNQLNISDDLLSRIRIRIKKILDNYVNHRLTSIAGKESTKSEAQQASIIYNNLTDEDFDLFIKSIKWQFNNEDPNEAVERVISNIKDLIPKIPLPLDVGMTEIYFSLLVNQVFQKSIQDEPNERKLTKDLLDSVLLNAGEEDDKWYATTYEQFKNFNLLAFYPGEFQAAVNAASYCRWKDMDGGHKNFWLNILKEYIDLADTPNAYKRKAINQYIFLKIGHDPDQDRSKSPISEDTDLLDFYIESWDDKNGIRDVDGDIIFLELLKGQINNFSLDYADDRVNALQVNLIDLLDKQEEKEINIDQLCEIYELQGHLSRVLNDNYVDGWIESFAFYRKIIPLLKDTHFYSLSGLYDQMKQMTINLANYSTNDELLEVTEEFMAEIEENAAKSGLRHKAAQDYIERAEAHLKRQNVSNTLKALELFHKAKDKWRLEYTRKGYMLSLAGIARVYQDLGMTYAAKYYALLAFWTVWQANDDNLRKYIPRAFSQIMNLDFIQGAWVNCISELELYLFSKREFDEQGFVIGNDEESVLALMDIALIYHSSKSTPHINEFIENIKSHFGNIWSQNIQPLVGTLSSKFSDDKSLNDLLQSKLVDLPYNDIGLVRKIRFVALGIDWNFQLENNPILVGIAEEFISFIQIELCEIAQSNPEIFSENKSVFVKIEKGHYQKKMVDENQWCITLPDFDSKVKEEVNRHYMYLGALAKTILQNVSVLNNRDYMDFYMKELLEKRKLGEKAQEAAAYQRVYKRTIMRESTDFAIARTLPEFNNENLRLRYIDRLVK